MKRLFMALLIVLLTSVCAWANDSTATQSATQQRAQVKQMTALGVSPEAAAKIQNHFREQHMVRAQNIIQAAKQENIPVHAVVDKALEGIAKNVPDENIVRAMEQVRNRYATAIAEARQMAQSRSRQQTMTRSMVQAMSAGMPPEDMSEIAKQIRSRQRTMNRSQYEDMAQASCLALRDMARMRTTPKEIKETIAAAMQHQFSAGQMNQMRSRFMHQVQNMAPDAVASQFQAHVRAGHDFGQNGQGSGSGSSGAGAGGDSSGSAGSGGTSGGSGGSGSGSGGSSGGSGGSGGNGGGSGGSGGGGKN